MTIKILPLTPDADQDIATEFEGIPLTVSLRQNAIAASWKIDLLSNDGAINVRGLRASPGVDILFGLAITELGALYISDVQLERSEPTYDGLGDQYIMWYLPIGDTLD